MMMLFKAGDGIPLKRGGTTEDVANACLFFASDMSGYYRSSVERRRRNAYLKNSDQYLFSV
jgi:NAD(P)-dependent dehydrogenase (short-subunit alcohol dehydrogenase family)